MNVGRLYAPPCQRGNQALHHGFGATHVKLVLSMWQRLLEQSYIDLSGMVVINAWWLGQRFITENNMQEKVRKLSGQFLKRRLKRMFYAVSNSIVQMDGSARLIF